MRKSHGHKGKFLLGLLASAGGYLWWMRRTGGDRDLYPAVAFKNGVGAKGSPGHVRDAGPDAMADDDGKKWGSVDEASDESFPASDPPSTY